MNINIVRVGTYTAIRGNVHREWEQMYIEFNGNKIELWGWQEDFGDKQGLTIYSSDVDLMDEEDCFVPDDNYIGKFTVTQQLVIQLLEKGRLRIR